MHRSLGRCRGRALTVNHEVDLEECRWGTLKDAAHWTDKQLTRMRWLQRSRLKIREHGGSKERLLTDLPKRSTGVVKASRYAPSATASTRS